MYHSVEKKYYYGFIDGLFVYDLEGNEFEIKDLLNNSIIAMSMLENSDGSVWVATSQNGLYLIKNKKVIKQITEAHGLSSNNCRRIKKDSSGIWIVTETGFDYYDFETNSLRNAALNLCIKGITINDICIDKNVVSLATNQGVYYFDKNVLNEMTLPRFMFKDFTVNGKNRSIDNDIILDYDENNNPIRVIDRIYSIRLLEELISYNRKGNFDLVSSLFMCMFQVQEEVLGKEYNEKKENNNVKMLLEMVNDMYKK